MDRRTESGTIRNRSGSLTVRETTEVTGSARKVRADVKCETLSKYFIFDKQPNSPHPKTELINCRILFSQLG